MTDWKARWQDMLKELEQERDEMRVKLHLAKEDAKDELAKLDDKIAGLKAKAAAFDKDGDGYMDDIGDAAKKMASDIRDGFQKLRERFQTGSHGGP